MRHYWSKSYQRFRSILEHCLIIFPIITVRSRPSTPHLISNAICQGFQVCMSRPVTSLEPTHRSPKTDKAATITILAHTVLVDYKWLWTHETFWKDKLKPAEWRVELGVHLAYYSLQIVSMFFNYPQKVISPKLLESTFHFFWSTGVWYSYVYPLHIVGLASQFYTPQWAEIQVPHFVSQYIYTVQPKKNLDVTGIKC